MHVQVTLKLLIDRLTTAIPPSYHGVVPGWIDGRFKEIRMTTKSAETANGAPKKRKPAAKKQTPATEPSREEIARLAEKYWAERGWPEGSPEQDWLRAERELKTAS